VQLAGDVLCVGLPAATLDAATARELTEIAPGAVLLFARNVATEAQVRMLVAGARAAIGGDAPALACVDQEGGRVARLQFLEPGVPSMLALGATDDAELARRVGARHAADCARVGANVDFAPVLDLALAPRSTVIGTRSLGDDPGGVAALGAALVRGIEGGGIASVPKHFPGHGATALDSHVTLPTIATPAAALRARDLVPFVAAFAAGASAVMTAHAIVSAFDAELPATLSHRVLTGLLRDELGFAGVCFTDCLEMDAIARSVGTAHGAVLALAAGADCCTISHRLALAREARDAIVAAVGDGTLPRARLEEAAARVRSLRARFAPTAERSDTPPETVAIASLVAARAVARLSGDVRLDPALPVTVVSFEGISSDGIAQHGGERPSLSLALRRRKFRSELLRVPLEPDAEMGAMLLDLLAAQGDRNIVVMTRRAHLYPGQRDLIAGVVARFAHTVGVSALEPFDAAGLACARGVACTFDDNDAAIDALADVLAGRAEATGRVPVALATTRA